MRQYLKKLRKEKGLTQLDVSKTIGVGASTYTMIENGDRHKILDLLWVERLAKCFEVSIDYIVTEERKLSGR